MILLLIISIPWALLIGIFIGLWLNRDRGSKTTVMVLDLNKSDEVPTLLKTIETISTKPILN